MTSIEETEAGVRSHYSMCPNIIKNIILGKFQQVVSTLGSLLELSLVATVGAGN